MLETELETWTLAVLLAALLEIELETWSLVALLAALMGAMSSVASLEIALWAAL
jgi:hypothetical protein